MRELSLNILDIAQNSLAAGARLINIGINVFTADGILEIIVEDDGKGMDLDTLKAVTGPFATGRTQRSVGLGIPFFKQSAEITGGSFEISSQKGKGTKVSAKYVLKSLNRMPMGDLAETVALLIAANPDTEFVLKVVKDGEKAVFDTRKIKAVTGEIPLSAPEVTAFLKRYIEDNITVLYGGLI